MTNLLNATAAIQRAAIVATVSCLATNAPALAQSGESVTVDVGECVDLESAEDRFACYEQRVDAVRRQPSASVSKVEPADATEAQSSTAPPKPESDAAVSAAESAPHASAIAGPKGRKTVPAGTAPATTGSAGAGAGPVQDIVGTIAELHETVPNSYLIRLDSGQVWRQMRPKWYPLRPGDEVRIYATRWGSAYRLTATTLSGFIQVEPLP